MSVDSCPVKNEVVAIRFQMIMKNPMMPYIGEQMIFEEKFVTDKAVEAAKMMCDFLSPTELKIISLYSQMRLQKPSKEAYDEYLKLCREV